MAEPARTDKTRQRLAAIPNAAAIMSQYDRCQLDVKATLTGTATANVMAAGAAAGLRAGAVVGAGPDAGLVGAAVGAGTGTVQAPLA